MISCAFDNHWKFLKKLPCVFKPGKIVVYPGPKGAAFSWLSYDIKSQHLETSPNFDIHLTFELSLYHLTVSFPWILYTGSILFPSGSARAIPGKRIPPSTPTSGEKPEI